MPAPPADMLVTIHSDSAPDGTKETVEECLESAGFHIFWEAGLNVRPFEQTVENESLVSETIDQIQAALPEAEITFRERENKDPGSGATYTYYLTIGEEPERSSEWRENADS